MISNRSSVTTVPSMLESKNHCFGSPNANPKLVQAITTPRAVARTKLWPASHATVSDMTRKLRPIFMGQKWLK